MNKKEWYGARTVYCIAKANIKSGYHLYEERIVVLESTSFDKAIREAEKEAKNYAKNSEIKYLGFVNVFKLSEDKIENKTEVYSLMRDSKLSEEKYLDKFFDTGLERTKK